MLHFKNMQEMSFSLNNQIWPHFEIKQEIWTCVMYIIIIAFFPLLTGMSVDFYTFVNEFPQRDTWAWSPIDFQ